MTQFLLALVTGSLLLTCAKAYQSVKLHESDPEAWEKLQHHEDDKRRRRQEMLGKAVQAVLTTVGGWFRREE